MIQYEGEDEDDYDFDYEREDFVSETNENNINRNGENKSDHEAVEMLSHSVQVLVEESNDNIIETVPSSFYSTSSLRRAASAIVANQANNHIRQQQCSLNNGAYQCECGQTFGNRTNLKRHRQRRHLGLKPYRCRWSNCNYSHSQRYQVVSHVRSVHLGLTRSSATTSSNREVDINSSPDDYVLVDRPMLKLMNTILSHES